MTIITHAKTIMAITAIIIIIIAESSPNHQHHHDRHHHRHHRNHRQVTTVIIIIFVVAPKLFIAEKVTFPIFRRELVLLAETTRSDKDSFFVSPAGNRTQSSGS